MKTSKEKKKKKTSKASEPYLEEWPHLNYYLHVFYYSWNRNSQFDGKYTYWNSVVLELWNSQGLSTSEIHLPQMTLAPAFTLRCSQDPSVIEAHMKQLCSALIGILALFRTHLIQMIRMANLLVVTWYQIF